MDLRAGPEVLHRAEHNPRSHRVQFRVAQGAPGVCPVHRGGIKAVLEEMACLAPADIHPATKRIVRPPYAASERIWMTGDRDEVDVIRHQAIAHQIKVMTLIVFGK